MTFASFGEFVSFLESKGELRRIKVEVDPRWEVTEIAVRALREQKPALLFEKIKGSAFPLVANAYASEKRINYALRGDPQELGEQLVSFFERMVPPNAASLWDNRRVVQRLFNTRTRSTSSGLAQQVLSNLTLDDLPVQTCWPEDGGRFLTLGQVVTYDPSDGKRNIGIYRMQVYDGRTAGMHWQIQKGGGFHYFKAEQQKRDLEVGVALGTDPALLLATVAALPEGLDEALLAAFLRGRATSFTKGKMISTFVPANAEFVLEGVVRQGERRSEGPFGDHFGHYSHKAPFPVFRLKKITHRRNPVYPATVVGIPPMEDKFLGDATQRILGPLVRLLHKEVKDVWAYYEAGFHNLLVASVEERYHKEAMKAALGLLGTGQLSLTKCMILVSEDVDPGDWKAVLRALGENFDPHFDFVLLPKVPLDTLDFTSFTMELGSKMIVDATRKQRSKPQRKRVPPEARQLRSLDRRITDARVVEDVLLLVKVRKDGRAVVEKLLKNRALQQMKMIAVVSDDVEIDDQENYIWGVFTRFDCERDVLFSDQRMIGISPVYNGVMGIDATWKRGYPNPLVMDADVVTMVDRRWGEYWK